MQGHVIDAKTKQLYMQECGEICFLNGTMIVGRTAVLPYGQDKVVFRNNQAGAIQITSAVYTPPNGPPVQIRALGFPAMLNAGEALTLDFQR